tara:strand:+ start:1357 stop:1758 length:402 start_codon:yes stop_codon:yes gene_type:complete
MELGGKTVEEAIDDFSARRIASVVDVGELITPEIVDEAFFEEIVRAVASGLDRYDGELKRALEQRGIDRVEVILRLILRAGAYEILDRPDIDPPLSINEYVAISEAFFGGTQPTFVNGVLDRLAREAAGDEQG